MSTLQFTGSTIDKATVKGFIFHLGGEGASDTIQNSIVMTGMTFPAVKYPSGAYAASGDVYINIWEGDGTNAYTYLASSTNATRCSDTGEGSTDDTTWSFSNVTLDPTKVYVVIFNENVSTTFGTSSTARMPMYRLENSDSTMGYYNNFGSSLDYNPPGSPNTSFIPTFTITYTTSGPEPQPTPEPEPLPEPVVTNTSLSIKVMSAEQLESEEISSSQLYVNNDTKQLLLGTKVLVGHSVTDIPNYKENVPQQLFNTANGLMWGSKERWYSNFKNGNKLEIYFNCPSTNPTTADIIWQVTTQQHTATEGKGAQNMLTMDTTSNPKTILYGDATDGALLGYFDSSTITYFTNSIGATDSTRWLRIHRENGDNVLYALNDDNYSIDALPDLTSWELQGTLSGASIISGFGFSTNSDWGFKGTLKNLVIIFDDEKLFDLRYGNNVYDNTSGGWNSHIIVEEKWV